MIGMFQVKAQMPLAERTYNDRDGQPQVLKSLELVLTDGINTMTAEMLNNRAEAYSHFDMKGAIVTVDYRIKMREWTNQQGFTTRANSIEITGIGNIFNETTD